jgi:hypothetical protein
VLIAARPTRATRPTGFLEEGDLVIGTEPADVAFRFFLGAFGVEGDEAFEDFGVGEGWGQP